MSAFSENATLVNSTYRVKWEISKEKFDNCDFPNKISSPIYAIDINGEKSRWYISLYPKGKEGNENQVQVSLIRKKGTHGKKYKVKYEFGIETQNGHWPKDALKKFYSRENLNHFDSFGDKSDEGMDIVRNGWGYDLCTTEEFQKYFIDNKVTVEAFFVIYGEDEHLKDFKVADEFTNKMRSMSSFKSLSDFTIVSGNERFPCHRVLLAATSQYFEALFRNEPSKKETVMEESPDLVKTLLDFMYKGLIPKDIDEKAMDLILMSDKYDLDLLTMACETSLVDNLKPDNAVETLITIDKIKHVSKEEHRKKVLIFIKTEVDLIAQTQDWKKFVQTYPELITEIIRLK